MTHHLSRIPCHKLLHCLVRLMLLMVFVINPANAASVYRWVDADGNVHFSDNKPQQQKAEQVEITAPVVKEPDEGELRRRALLKQAQDNKTTQAEKPFFPEAESTRSPEMCKQARIHFGVLREPMPVYWTTDGQLKPAWSNDTYQGERRYVDDEERPQLLLKAQANMNKHCANPNDIEARDWVYRLWEHSQWCDALAVQLATARRPQTRTPDDVVEKIAAQYRGECGG